MDTPKSLASIPLTVWLAAALLAVPAADADDAASHLFDPHAVAEVNLTLPLASITALDADPREYQPADVKLTADGTSYGPFEVGVRLKGGLGSFRPLNAKAAFKVKLNLSVAGQKVLGLKKLTLNNMVQDASNLHEVLAYDLLRAMGVPAPRTGYAYVRVNGADYGLYVNVETFDDVSLPRWFASTQHLYEGEYGADAVPGGAKDFQIDEGDKTDRADLEALIAEAGGGDTSDWFDRMARRADLGEMTRLWAGLQYIGGWDSYAGGVPHPKFPNNFYLHSDRSGRFSMLPWGQDQTWNNPLTIGNPGPGRLFSRCLDDARCAAAFRDAVGAARAAAATLDLDARAARLAKELAPWQTRDPRSGYSPAQIREAVATTRAFIADRPAAVEAWLRGAAGR